MHKENSARSFCSLVFLSLFCLIFKARFILNRLGILLINSLLKRRDGKNQGRVGSYRSNRDLSYVISSKPLGNHASFFDHLMYLIAKHCTEFEKSFDELDPQSILDLKTSRILKESDKFIQ